jgi:hypothetical protein
MTYEPKPRDLVRVVKCRAGDPEHLDAVGLYSHDWPIEGIRFRVVSLDDNTLCYAGEVAPATPPASEVYARAEHDCSGKDPQSAADKVIAEMRSERLIALDQITTKLLDLMATVHGLRVELQDKLRGEQTNQKEGEGK